MATYGPIRHDVTIILLLAICRRSVRPLVLLYRGQVVVTHFLGHPVIVIVYNVVVTTRRLTGEKVSIVACIKTILVRDNICQVADRDRWARIFFLIISHENTVGAIWAFLLFAYERSINGPPAELTLVSIV